LATALAATLYCLDKLKTKQNKKPKPTKIKKKQISLILIIRICASLELPKYLLNKSMALLTDL